VPPADATSDTRRTPFRNWDDGSGQKGHRAKIAGRRFGSRIWTLRNPSRTLAPTRVRKVELRRCFRMFVADLGEEEADEANDT